MTEQSKVTQADLEELRVQCGLLHTPTPETYHYRNAVNGCGGPHEYDWQDKPRRLVIDLCNIIEALAAQPSNDELLRKARGHVSRCKTIACAEGPSHSCQKAIDLLARIDARLNGDNP